jgi:hypothetical protein
VKFLEEIENRGLEGKVEQKRILEHLEFTFKEKVEEKVTEIKKEVEEKSHGHPKRCRGKGGRNQERRRTNKRKLRREGKRNGSKI